MTPRGVGTIDEKTGTNAALISAPRARKSAWRPLLRSSQGSGRLPAEIGALVVKALDAAVNDPTVQDVSAETPAAQPKFGLIVFAGFTTVRCMRAEW